MSSPLLLKDILTFLGEFAPWELAETWDNVGLMVGNPDQNVEGVLVALDPSLSLLDEAIESKANIILTHHPLIFHPLKSINTASPFGKLLKKALNHNIAIVSCHTNLDIIGNGVSDALSSTLGLQKTQPLTTKGTDQTLGFGKVGDLVSPMAGSSFLKFVAEKLGLTGLPVAGSLPESITRVAVCGGSGSELAETAQSSGAQIFITAEVKHSIARWAEENGLCIIDAGHFATENIIIPRLVTELKDFLAEKNKQIPVLASTIQSNPLRLHFFKDMTLTPT